MLCKVKDFVSPNVLKSIYYAIFESRIDYACIIWGQNSTINGLYILQKKALRIINFKDRNAHSSPLFHYFKIIKIADKVKIENCLFINNHTKINYLQFLLIGLHFHQFLTIIKHPLPLKEIFKSLGKKSYGKNAFVNMVIRTGNNIHIYIHCYSSKLLIENRGLIYHCQ